MIAHTSTGRSAERGALVATALVALALLGPGGAVAGEYTVRSCDAAPPTYSTSGWGAQAGSVNTYRLCPSPSGSTPNGRGMVTRAVGRTFSAGEYSRLWFHAPPGTTITRLDWSGRWARNTPSWAVEIRAQGGTSDSRLVGVPAQPGAQGYQTSSESPAPYPIWTPPGTTRLLQNTQCGAGHCNTGGTFHTYYAAVTLNDHSPPAVSLAGIAHNEWVRGDRDITFSASDNIGIKSAHLYVDGKLRESRSYPCDYTQPTACANRSGVVRVPSAQLTPGPHEVEVRVHDGSDTPASVKRTIRVDNDQPEQIEPVVAGGEGWRNRNGFTVRWQSVADAGSPIVGGTWELCRPGRTACVSGGISQPDPTGLANLLLATDGAHELRVALRDQAGNVALLRDAGPVALRLDRAAPTVSIDRLDPSAPLAARASVSDPLSGVAGGVIEMRRTGTSTWHEIATVVQGSKLVATIDDERAADGSHELRARATDRAGNESSTYTEASGARALRQLPVRVKTRLRAGQRTVKVVRRMVGRGNRRRIVKRKRVRLNPRATVPFRRRRVVTGRLANPDGQPLADVPITVLSKPDLPGGAFATVGLVRTDSDGQFRYRVRGTTSRTLRFRYDGTARIRPSETDVTVRVPASSTFKLTPSRIINGETVTFRGRVRGGPIPEQGKLVELRKWNGRRWEPFRVVRTDPHGRWRHTEPVRSVTGLFTFRLRAHLPAEAGFPYSRGRTVARKLRVRGLRAPQ